MLSEHPTSLPACVVSPAARPLGVQRENIADRFFFLFCAKERGVFFVCYFAFVCLARRSAESLAVSYASVESIIIPTAKLGLHCMLDTGLPFWMDFNGTRHENA